MISVKNLTKIYKVHRRQKNLLSDFLFRKFEEHTALNSISFEIEPNEFVGFIGPNGAGKTTTLKILSGILYPSEGSVSVLGGNPFDKKHSFLRSIAFIMGQRNQLIWDLPAKDSFLLQKAVYEIEEQAYNETLSLLLEMFSCSALILKPVKTLSLGERMKMELIAGLLHRPKLVFLDEPTIGLDIFSQEAIRTFIRSYQEHYKSTVILTSHYMEDVKRLAKHLMIIDKGNLLYNGTLQEIIKTYSQEKQIKITLEEPVSEQKIREISRPVSLSFPQIVYSVRRPLIPDTIRRIVDSLPFSDLTVEDESIEEVIKRFFHKKRSP